MARTTATVTVGADTTPFAKKMRSLGDGITKRVSAGASRLGSMATGGLAAGFGAGLGMLGIQGLGGIFNQMLAVSPELNAEFNKLKVSVAEALVPMAVKLAEILRQHMPAIQEGLATFGVMLADAIQFWTEDAFDPSVWADIGDAIAGTIKDALQDLIFGEEAMNMAEGSKVGKFVGEQTGSEALGALAGLASLANLPVLLSEYLSQETKGTEGAQSL